MATALLRRAGMEINAKRVQRLWRQEGLRVPRRQCKRARLGSSENGTQRLSAERVNHVWSYDFVMDQTEDGRRLKWLPICDEFSRECVALEVERRMEARDVIRILDAAVAERGSAPEFIRSDNGPEFVVLAVQDWIARQGFKTLSIKPGSPWQNAYSESLNSRFRDEFLNRELFSGLMEAKVLGKEHRHRHNHQRPHSSLDYQTPAEFAQRSLAAANLPPNTKPTTQTPKSTKNSHSEWIKNRGQATASLAIFVAIGFAVRWDVKGTTLSLAGEMTHYFTALAKGGEMVFALPFMLLAVWMFSAIALGWLLQCILVMFAITREKLKSPA